VADWRDTSFPKITCHDVLRTGVTAFIAWALGMGNYALMAWLVYDQPVVFEHDFYSACIWSAIALALTVVLFYLPAMVLLRHVLNGYKPLRMFLYLGIAIGILPVAMIVLYWSHSLREMFSHEAFLFYCMFGVVGLIMGLGFAVKRELPHQAQGQAVYKD
tara:strand:+ start:375 stop:854 length:480 start_codon:yes stop_codon:yes gene_type:complete